MQRDHLCSEIANGLVRRCELLTLAIILEPHHRLLHNGRCGVCALLMPWERTKIAGKARTSSQSGARGEMKAAELPQVCVILSVSRNQSLRPQSDRLGS